MDNGKEQRNGQLMAEGEILLLDGATGTVLTAAGMPRGTCTEQWILENPEPYTKLAAAYVEAGSQVIYAPTFGGNRKRLSAFGLEGQLRDMNLRLTALAQEAGAGRVRIAGDLSPTGLLPESAGGDASVEEIFEIYREQALVLCEAGVDLFAVETMMSTDETVIAVDAIRSVSELPVLCSFSCYADGKNYYDGTVLEAAAILQEMGVSAVGINCASGPLQIGSLVSALSREVDIPILAKPNAGLPAIDETGRAVYDMDEEAFAAGMRQLVEAGARVIGGCCGTGPSYINSVRKMLEERRGI